MQPVHLLLSVSRKVLLGSQDNLLRWIPIAFFCGLFLYALLINRVQLPYSERSALLGLDMQQEYDFSQAVWQQQLHQKQMVTSGNAYVQIQRIEARLRSALEHIDPLRKRQWRLLLLRSDHPDIWALPSGQVIISSALLPIARTSDRLAGLVAHSIGHTIARHGAERSTRGLVPHFGSAISILELNWPSTYLSTRAWFGISPDPSIQPYNPAQEREAQAIASALLRAACYPHEAIQSHTIMLMAQQQHSALTWWHQHLRQPPTEQDFPWLANIRCTP